MRTCLRLLPQVGVRTSTKPGRSTASFTKRRRRVRGGLAVPEKTVHLPMLTNVGNNKPTEALAENTVDFGGTGRRKASGSHLVSEPAEQTCVEML